MQPKAPIDTDFLAVQTWRDAGLQRDVLQLFVEQARQARRELDGESYAIESLAATLHTLKGSALSLGANQVAELAAEAESQIAQAPFRPQPETDRSLRRLAAALAEASAFAARLLDEDGGIGLAKQRETG